MLEDSSLRLATVCSSSREGNYVQCSAGDTSLAIVWRSISYGECVLELLLDAAPRQAADSFKDAEYTPCVSDKICNNMHSFQL